MGRKTFESLGKPLPNRTNIVVTRNPDLRPEGCVVVGSLEDGLEAARQTGASEAFVIGGAEIYRQALPHADRLYLTEVKAAFEGDTYFPAVDFAAWREVIRRPHAPDDRHTVAFDFVVWQK